MKRLCTALALALLAGCTPAFAQGLNVRSFDRTVDPRNVTTTDKLTWYAGESVEYIIRSRRGREVVDVPPESTVVWRVRQDTNDYLVAAGEVVTNGTVRFRVYSPDANLAPGLYTSWAEAFQGTNLVGVLERASVEVKWRPGDDYAIVQPITNLFDQVLAAWNTACSAGVAVVQGGLTAHVADTENPHGVTAEQIGALTAETDAAALSAIASVSGRVDTVEGWGDHAEAGYLTAEEAEVLLAAGTNIVVESVGGPLLEDFATAEFRVSGSGWGVTATGAAVNYGNVIARENTLGLRENFTIAFTNIRSSVEGVLPTATAGTNISNGPFSKGSWDMAGNTATGLHWAAGVQSGAVGVVECTLGTWTGKTSRTFPGYTATTNVHEFLGFVPGSLRATVDADMLARNATGLINPYETLTTWPNLVRNTNVWTKDMDLTCVPPYSSLRSWTYNFTLVTPQHFVFASHWPPTGTNSSLIDGHTLYFVDSTNGLHSREVVKARQVWLDCSVGLLDTPLPPSVTPAKIIDTNDFAKFKGVETLRPGGDLVGPSGMIGVHVRPNYARAVRVPFDPPTPDSNTYWWSSRDPDLRLSDTHSGANYVGGESGTPVLLCIEGQTVIAQTLYTGGGAGPHIAALRSQIEATMATLGESVYTNLETINLAHWPDYP